MKCGKTAICLSGSFKRPFDDKIIRGFFNNINESDTFYSYDVFLHAYCDAADHNYISSTFTPFRHRYDTDYSSCETGTYEKELYGVMIANELKRQHEIENDFRYDLVIKADLNSMLYAGNAFPIHHLSPRTLYSCNKYIPETLTNFSTPAIFDEIYWGDSQSVDVAASLYRYYRFHCVVESFKIDCHEDKAKDPKDYYFDKRALLYSRLVKHNIKHEKTNLW